MSKNQKLNEKIMSPAFLKMLQLLESMVAAQGAAEGVLCSPSVWLGTGWGQGPRDGLLQWDCFLAGCSPTVKVQQARPLSASPAVRESMRVVQPISICRNSRGLLGGEWETLCPLGFLGISCG